MIVKVAPIIHTRTFYNDFLSSFLVRPDYFTSEDIDWARRFIRASTADIDLMKGKRYVVLDNGKIRIAGIVTITSELAEKSKQVIDKRYFHDDKGRNIFAFIGICIKSPLETYISLTNEVFAEIFENFVVPVFDNKIVDTQLVSDIIDLDKSKVAIQPSDPGIKLNNCTIYESSLENDKKWFNYYLCCKQQKFSFCSNVSKYQTVKESIFDYISTTPNNKKRLEYDIPAINNALRVKEEADYQHFKVKYQNRILKEFDSIFRQKFLKDADFIKIIQNEQKTIEAIINQLYNGNIKETEHYKIIEFCKISEKMLHDLRYGKDQKPIIILKKENPNNGKQ